MITAILTLANTGLLIGGLVWVILTWRNHLGVLNTRTQDRVDKFIDSNLQLSAKVSAVLDAIDRNWIGAEQDREVAAGVASDLIAANEVVAGVARDLASGRERAALVQDGAPGEAADAAVVEGTP